MALPTNPGTYVEVVVQRTVTQEMRVGVTVEPGSQDVEGDAAKTAMAMKQVRGTAGWEDVAASEPVVSTCQDKGDIVYREREFPRGRRRWKSTGRPAQA